MGYLRRQKTGGASRSRAYSSTDRELEALAFSSEDERSSDEATGASGGSSCRRRSLEGDEMIKVLSFAYFK